MSLCRIETNDPNNPACIDPLRVDAVIRGSKYGSPGLYVHLHHAEHGQFIETALTTRDVVALLKAHREPTEREAILIAGLRRLADPHDATDHLLTTDFATIVLRDAGVAGAEPEQTT
jgi:hypothetical protein